MNDIIQRKCFIGNYLPTQDKNVYCVDIAHDLKQGSVLTPMIAAGPNPSFIVFNKNRSHMYAVNEMNMQEHGQHGSVVNLVSDDADIYRLHKKLSTKGDYPCHVALSKNEHHLFVTNYGSGTLCVYALDSHGMIESLAQCISFTGSGPHKDRQESSHPHQSFVTPNGKYVYVTDLGCDRIYTFSVTSIRTTPLILINTTVTPPGSGPRHMALSDCGRYLYVSGELSSSVLVFTIGKDSKLTCIQECPAFPAQSDLHETTIASEIAYHNGYVYMANRGDDSIAIFKQQQDGTLIHISNVSCEGTHPRHFSIVKLSTHQDVLIVANQHSDNIAVFQCDGDNLLFLHSVPVKSPACICVI